MKLPADNNISGEDQGRSGASESSSVGASSSSDASSGGAPSSSSPSSGSGGSDNNSANGPSQQPQSAQSQNPSDVDFSEYLWMENEEEFDSQVLQELEDEEMINYYYELYEASLNENGTWGPNTANLRVTGPPPPYTPGQPEEDAVDSLAQGLNSRLTFNSRLNPEAAEFVPRTTSNPN